MQRLATVLGLLLGLLLLAACTYTYRWSLPPKTSDRDLQRDHAACTGDAEVASQGFAGKDPWVLYEQCMTARGYKKTGGSWRF